MQTQAGFEYTGEVSRLSKKITRQGQQLTQLQQGQEDEMGLAMQRELRLSEFAANSRMAAHLRQLKSGAVADQEFDVVLLDGNSSAFVGWHKTHAKDVSHLYQMKSAVEKLMSRAANASSGQYADFKDREIGLCYMVEKIDPKQVDRVAKECRRLGIVQFTRTGHAMSMSRKWVQQPHSQQRPLRRAHVMIKPLPTMHMVRSFF